MNNNKAKFCLRVSIYIAMKLLILFSLEEIEWSTYIRNDIDIGMINRGKEILKKIDKRTATDNFRD